MTEFLYREPAKIVQDVIQQSMGLSDGQVMFSNQKIFIPTPGPLIVVRYLGPAKIISNVDEWSDVAGVLTEIQTMCMWHLLQVDIMSYDDVARLRKEEIAFAVNSLLSQAQQEMFNMNITRHMGSFLDKSFLEETKQITCYTSTISTVSVLMKQQPVKDYYQDFSRAVPPKLAVNA